MQHTVSVLFLIEKPTAAFHVESLLDGESGCTYRFPRLRPSPIRPDDQLERSRDAAILKPHPPTTRSTVLFTSLYTLNFLLPHHFPNPRLLPQRSLLHILQHAPQENLTQDRPVDLRPPSLLRSRDCPRKVLRR
jgi:hypothetical protein